MKEIRNISIAGAGTMGYSLAQAFAKFGYPVKLYDLFPAALEKAKKLIAINQSAEVEAGELTAEESAALMEEFFRQLRVDLRSRPKWKKPER